MENIKVLGNVHHIGYMVKNIKKAIDGYTSLGFSLSKESIWDEDRKSNICFLDGQGITIELIEPSKDSDLAPLIKKFRNVPYHVCYEVDNMEIAIQQMLERGFSISKPTERALAISNTARVTFLTHARLGVIELVSNITKA